MSEKPTLPERFLEVIRPRRGELEMPDLTPEEKARLRSLMNQAKQAEEENRLPEAIELYQKVKTEFLAIKEAKDKEKRGSEQVITAQTPEGKEIVFDPREIRAASDVFYRAHGLEEFADALPEEIRLSKESEARLREAMEAGFDRAVLLPSPELQNQTFDRLFDLAKYPGEKAPYIWSKEEAEQAAKKDPENPIRPEEAAYLLLYQSGPIPKETKNKNFSQAEEELDKLFGKDNWNGLTLQEHLILQRKEFGEREDHSFDAYSDDPSKSQWTWLLDSRVPAGCVDAYWYPADRRVEVYRDVSGDALPLLGARPVVVVKIL